MLHKLHIVGLYLFIHSCTAFPLSDDYKNNLCNGQSQYTVGVKSLSPFDIYLVFLSFLQHCGSAKNTRNLLSTELSKL